MVQDGSAVLLRATVAVMLKTVVTHISINLFVIFLMIRMSISHSLLSIPCRKVTNFGTQQPSLLRTKHNK
jgi:hypothetical protein